MTKAQSSTADFRRADFLLEQSQKLVVLLERVQEDAKKATDPQACVDYIEITAILTDLLDQAYQLAAVPSDARLHRYDEFRTFAGQLPTLEDLVADWDVRRAPDQGNSQSTSRKRSRSSDDYAADTAFALKRQKSAGSDVSMMIDKFLVEQELSSVDCDASPQVDSTAWWTEPFYD